MVLKIFILVFFIINVCSSENIIAYCEKKNTNWTGYLKIYCKQSYKTFNKKLNHDKKYLQSFCKGLGCYREYEPNNKSNTNFYKISKHLKESCNNDDNLDIFYNHFNESCILAKKVYKKIK